MDKTEEIWRKYLFRVLSPKIGKQNDIQAREVY